MYRIKFNSKYICKGINDWCFKLGTQDESMLFDSEYDANVFIGYMGLNVLDSRIEVEKV